MSSHPYRFATSLSVFGRGFTRLSLMFQRLHHLHAVLLAAAFFSSPYTVCASPVTKTFTFTASGFSPAFGNLPAPDDPVTGTFTVSYDTAVNTTGGRVDAIDLTIAGFTFTRRAVRFEYNAQYDRLLLGGTVTGIRGTTPGTNDFSLSFLPATTDAHPFNAFASFFYANPADDFQGTIGWEADSRIPPSNVVVMHDRQPAVSPLVVENVWTADGAGNDTGTFNPGDPIQYAVRIRNSSSQVTTATLTYVAQGPISHCCISPHIIFSDTQESVTVPPGVSTFYSSSTLPGDEGGYYDIRISLTPAGPSHSAGLITFTVLDGAEVSYFALGDSVASGHGLFDDTDSGESAAGCRQSDRAYPYKVRDHLAARYDTVHFYHLACSGAAVIPRDDAPANYPYKSFRNQVDEALEAIATLRSSHPVLVSITIGANNFRFFDIPLFTRRLHATDDLFYEWVDLIVTNVEDSLRRKVKRLLRSPNVAVVITGYHNPYNTNSLLFYFPTRGLNVDNPFNCYAGACYPRTSYLVSQLNGSFLDIFINLRPYKQARLQIAPVDARFNGGPRDGHEAPQLECGRDPPTVNDTWVQYPTDLDSNSYPLVPTWLRDLTGLQAGWRGDCFHPTEKGAEAYAAAVNAAAIRLGR